MTLYGRLVGDQDLHYKEFQSKLVPTISPERIIGIRTPQLRKTAKSLFLSTDRDHFLNDLPHTYYEEDLIHFFVLSMIRDFEQCIRGVESFLPYINCWPVSDQATPLSFKNHHQDLLPHVRKWIESEHIYTARFGIRMLMNEYLGKDFKPEYLDIVASKQGEDYYLKMMIAWFFATALAKRYDETVPYVENHMLSEWVHRKTIQKALESYRISPNRKSHLKSLRP